MLVRDLMTAAVTWVLPHSAVSCAVDIMKSEDVGLVPVCDLQNKVLGVITDRDIILRGLQGKLCGEIMTGPAVCIPSKADVHDAALKMAEKGVRRLIVTENEKIVGVLSLKDLAKKRIYIAEVGHIIYEICSKKP